MKKTTTTYHCDRCNSDVTVNVENKLSYKIDFYGNKNFLPYNYDLCPGCAMEFRNFMKDVKP